MQALFTFSLFFCILAPHISIIILIFFCIQYYLDKYNFLYIYPIDFES